MAENDKIPADEYERELATDLDDDTPDKPKGMPLHTKILLGLTRRRRWRVGGELDARRQRRERRLVRV